MYMDLELSRKFHKPIVDCTINGFHCNACVDTGADSFHVLYWQNKIGDNPFKMKSLNKFKRVNGAAGSGNAPIYEADIVVKCCGEMDKNDILMKDVEVCVTSSNIKDLDLLIPYGFLYKFGFRLIKDKNYDILRLENVPYKFSCFNVVYDKNMVVTDILTVNNDSMDNS